MEIKEMMERAERLHEHLIEHPSDYQSVIAELKLRSAIIDKARKERVNERLKEVARIRKRRKDAEQRQRDGNG